MVPSGWNGEGQLDQLTGLPNRREFLSKLEEILPRLNGDTGPVAVLFVDIDGFRRISRERGHAIGDELLFSVSRRIASRLGPGEVLARAGGDEFVVMVCDLDAPRDFAELGSRILAAFDDPFALSGQEFSATVSIGAAVTEDASTRPEALIADAEAALERSPLGSRRFEVFDAELREQMQARADMGRELALALDSQEVRLCYQPIVDIASGRIVSVEALARWHHPEQGPVSPEVFVGLAQEIGLGNDLLRALLGRAGTDFAAIAKEDPTARVSLAVNVSAADLASPTLISVVESLIARCKVAPERIMIEISESALTGAATAYLARVSELRDLGVRISLDDFGTASTSISQLRSLPIDQIKLDRSFVEGLGASAPDAALAAGLLPIARALGIEVVAEGIETDQQLAHLFALGYRLGQGYRFAVAIPPEEVAALLARGPLATARMSETEMAASAREHFRQALVAGDAKQAEAVVAAALSGGVGAMTIQTEIIGRALHWIDTEWEAGRLRAADEHLAAAICERQLAVVLEATRRPERRFSPRVLIAAIGGEGHQGELTSAAEALDSAGYETVSLGDDVGGAELEAAAGTHHPGAVCLSLPGAARRGDLLNAVDRLAAISEPPVVLVGGEGIGKGRGTGGAIPFTSNQDALDVLAHELRDTRTVAASVDELG